MKDLLKNIVLIVLIVAIAFGIGFLVFRAIKSVNYNKEAKNPVLTLEVENYGEIQIELEPDYAPNTVATIIKLAQNGYYDGKVFYGTDETVVAAGMELTTETQDATEENADPTTKQVAKEDKLMISDLDKNVSADNDHEISILGEFVANGFDDNTLRFERGTVALYRSTYTLNNLTSESYNSGKSLFFITTKDEKKLNGDYAAFGKVINGMDIVDKLVTLATEESGENSSTSEAYTSKTLTEDKEIKKFAEGTYPVITKATVETYGIDYGMPVYQSAFDYDQYLSDLIMQYYSNQ